MGRQSISRKAWQRATNALLWYPDNLQEYADLGEELMTRNPDCDGGGSKPLHQDPTQDAAIRRVENARLQNLEAEITAVEIAMAKLSPEQKEVIRRRFWDRRCTGRRRKPRQYDFLQDLPYSLDGMRWIVRETIRRVAECLGEK